MGTTGKKRIVHVISGLQDGGAERTLMKLCSNDHKNTHMVISLTNLGKYGERLKAVGIPVLEIDMRTRSLPIQPLWRLGRVLKQKKPDVVQTWMYHGDLIGGLVARLVGVGPIVWNVRHTDLRPSASSRATIWIARVCGVLSRLMPSKIICCAHSAAIVHARLGYDSSRMVVVANGFERVEDSDDDSGGCTGDRKRAVLEALGVKGSPFVMTHVARFNPQKNHKGLIRSLELLAKVESNFVCLLIGSGVDSSNFTLVDAIRKAGLESRVFLLGQREDINELLRGADLNLLCSTFGEGFPNVVAESMAVGTPSVVTDTGDASIIVGENGWVVQPESAGEFAHAILGAMQLRKDETAWNELREQCRADVRDRYSIEAMIAHYNAVWAEVTANRHTRRQLK